MLSADETTRPVCVTAKIGCNVYASSNLTKCHTCKGDYRGDGGAAFLYDSCICQDNTKISVKDDNDDDVCATEIPECDVYLNTNLS